MIGPDVIMGDVQHYITDLSAHVIFTHGDCEHFLKFANCETHCLRERYGKTNKIIIGNDVWIGRRAMIMRGVKIGNGAVIGAGAVVTKDVLPYSIVGGVPAKLIKFRYSIDIIAELEKIEWWNYGPDIMDGIDMQEIQSAIENLRRKKLEKNMYKPQVVVLNPKNNSIRVE